MLHEAQTSLDTSVRIRGVNVPVDAINKFAALPEGWMSGQMEKLDVDLSGLLSSPVTWNGSVAAERADFHPEQTAFGRGVFQGTAKNGIATLQSADITRDKNEFHLRGSTELPRDVHDLGRAPASMELAATLPDLQQVMAGISQKLSGSAEVSGKISVKNSIVNGDLAITSPSIEFQDGRCENLNAAIKLSKKIPPSAAGKPWFSDLVSDATVAVSAIRYRDYIADSLEGTLHAKDNLVTFDRLIVKRKENEFTLSGDYRLPKDFRDLDQQPAKVDISFNAAQLADCWVPDSRDKISGPLQAIGQIEWKKGVANGQVSILGANLRMRDLVFTQLTSQFVVWNNVVYLNDVSANLTGNDFISGNAIYDLRGRHRYSGKFRAHVSDLSKLQPLLRTFGNQNELAGSLVVEWEGDGEAAKIKTGKLRLALDNGRYGNARSLQATADATYSPDGLDVPTIFLRSDKMYFQAIAQAKGETLEISKIELDQGQAKYAGGYVSIPFVWKNLGTDAAVLPSNGRVTAVFQSENLDIKKLFQDVGLKPAASGLLNVKLDASGTLADLNARLDVQMRNLRAENLPKFEPASFDLIAQAQGKQLAISGKLQQAKIQPLELTANFPFDVPKVVHEKKMADETPVTAKMRLARSSVNFMRQFIPGVEELDGDAALDVDVRGTIARPVFSGSGDMTINVARMTDPPLPPASRPNFSIPQPPFRDWKFDVAIKTKDPFLIRGNLANGGAISDLHLTGSGLHPGLDGWIRLDKVDATLPFSRLEISSGFLYFDPTDPLNPKIDIHGRSVIRDYTINVYIYGRTLAPEAIFTSEPPLPQEEIISLLATGTTREELTGNNNVLAGRAAMLLVQQLYRKIFKKGQGTQSSSVFDRLDLDVGTVDPRTGQQQAIARFKINDQFVLLGDLGVGGDYRGMVKYLIRFK